MQEPTKQFDHARFRQLFEDKCNEALDEKGVAELQDMLLASSDARVAYWAALEVHADLESELTGNADWIATVQNCLEEKSIGEQHRGGPRSIDWPVRLALAMAACVLVALGSFFASREYWRQNIALENGPRGPAPDQDVPITPALGHVSSLQPNSRWSFGRAGDWNSDEFQLGDTISVDEGAVRVRLASQTTATLRAPVVMQLATEERLRLMRGHIVVTVAKGDEGFTVETAAAEVIDLGTVFSVDVEGRGTNVIVFDGAIDLRVASRRNQDPDEDQTSVTKRFEAGEAVHVGDDGTLSRIVNVQHWAHSQGDQPSDEERLISAVRDNIVRDDMWSFYEIIPNGLREDARAYVDRPHEWNGSTANGIPDYLLGADYVRTFCDDKITSDLILEVELQHPADIYIFMDNRLELPTWLLDRFEDTGDDIGLDESYNDSGRRAKVGPAAGIDQTFSIWRLSAPQDGNVRLGHNGNTTPEEISRGVRLARAGMYGIAAVRLEQDRPIPREVLP